MSVLSKLSEFLFGGSTAPVTAVVTVAKDVSDIVDRWAPSAEHKQEMSEQVHNAIAAGVAQARAADTPTQRPGFLNDLADGLNRLVRPVITFTMIGGLYGWVKLPTTGSVEPVVLYWIGGLFTYWFGTRMLFKDIPDAILYLRKGK